MAPSAGSKLRLGVVLPSLRESGCEHQVARMLFGLVREFDVTLILYRREIAYPIPDGLRIVSLAFDPSTSGGLAYKGVRFGLRVAKIARLFAEQRFDVILGFIDMNNVIVGLASRLSGASSKVIAVERTINEDFFRTNPVARRMAAIIKPMLTWAYSNADRSVAISHSMRSYMQSELGVRRPIDVIMNGVDTRTYHPSHGEPPPASLDERFGRAKLRLLHVGGFNYRKNHSFLLDNLTDIRRRFPEAELFLIGNGPLEKSARDRARQLGIADAVTFLGWRDDVADYMRHSDVLLLSSLSEGTPNVVYEALACGLPVVTTESTGALHEMLRDPRHGRIVAIGDGPAFVDAVEQTLRERSPQHEARRQWGREYGDQFEWHRCERSYISLVYECAGASFAQAG